MKLWEVLKELEENPKKVFESSLAGLEYKISLDGEVTAFESSAGKFTGLNNCRDWQEVKQPVTWQEAIEAWANGGKVKCILHDKSHVYDRSKWGNMYSGDGYLCDSEILNGTWYIED